MPNMGSRRTNLHQPYPVGHRRQEYPEAMGWAELLKYSGRTDVAVRQMRGREPDAFPEPMYVLAVTPVYVADEVRAFFDPRPRLRARITKEIQEQIYALRNEQGKSQQQVADMLDISVQSVRRYDKQRPTG